MYSFRTRPVRSNNFYKLLSDGKLIATHQVPSATQQRKRRQLAPSPRLGDMCAQFVALIKREIVNLLKFRTRASMVKSFKTAVFKPVYSYLRAHGFDNKWRNANDFFAVHELPQHRSDSKGESISILPDTLLIKVSQKKPIVFYDNNLCKSSTNESYVFCLQFLTDQFL